jgi:hypothetical protein
MGEITWSLPVEAAEWLKLKAAEYGLTVEALMRKSVAHYVAHGLRDGCPELAAKQSRRAYGAKPH